MSWNRDNDHTMTLSWACVGCTAASPSGTSRLNAFPTWWSSRHLAAVVLVSVHRNTRPSQVWVAAAWRPVSRPPRPYLLGRHPRGAISSWASPLPWPDRSMKRSLSILAAIGQLGRTGRRSERLSVDKSPSYWSCVCSAVAVVLFLHYYTLEIDTRKWCFDPGKRHVSVRTLGTCSGAVFWKVLNLPSPFLTRILFVLAIYLCFL